MKAFCNRLPLFLKIWVLFSLLILAVIVPSGILLVSHAKQLVFSEMIGRGDLLARQFATGARIPLLSGDDLALKLLVKGVENDPGILCAVINDKNDKVVARTGDAGAQEILLRSSQTERSGLDRRHPPQFNGPKGRTFFAISAPVVYHAKTIGTFHLALSKDPIEKEMNGAASRLIRGFLLYCIPGFILGLIALFFFSKYVAGQVLRLVSDMDRLRDDHEVRIEKVPRGLFGELASAFNRLSLSLEEASRRQKTVVPHPQPNALKEHTVSPAPLLPTQITRNQIAVLFAGVKGFREYADNRAPEDVIVDLNEYFALAARIAGEHDGKVDKFIGDAVSCVFQSMPLKPDHITRAVEAAVALQAALADQSQNGNEIMGKIGIGISSGVALAGSVEALPDKVHTFIGESFKTAYSLNVLAGPGEIIMSKDVFQAVEHLVTVEPIPPREMMDKTEAWENFRLKGLLPGGNHESSSG